MTRRPRGFSIIEIVISMAIIGAMLVAVLGTVGASQAMQFKGAQQSEALLLAEDLMAEILQASYEDPDQAPEPGFETGEDTGDRSKFDDVDDYHGWSQTPPQRQDGTVIDWASAYHRQVSVSWIEPDDLNAISPTETGIKGVRVKVSYGTTKVITLIAAKSEAGSK